MTEPTVESIFGTKAGVVWRALNQNGPTNIGDLVRITSLSREEVFGAIGWLGRENKILVEKRGRAMVFSLREAEAPLEASKSTTIEDSAPQEQKQHRASKHPKKTAKAKRTTKAKTAKKARKVKAPIQQSERMKEFLLH